VASRPPTGAQILLVLVCNKLQLLCNSAQLLKLTGLATARVPLEAYSVPENSAKNVPKHFISTQKNPSSHFSSGARSTFRFWLRDC